MWIIDRITDIIEWRETLHDYQKTVISLRAQLAQAEKERDELREAIHSVLDPIPTYLNDSYWGKYLQGVRDSLTTALKKGE